MAAFIRRRASGPAPRAASRHRLDDLHRGRVEQREDALLLVGEVLVEGRLRHSRPAADRLRAGAGVPDARELLGGRPQQPLALERQAHLERRRVAAAGGSGWRESRPLRPSASGRSGARSTRGRRRSGSAPTTRRCRDTSRPSAPGPRRSGPARSQPEPLELAGGERVAAVVARAVGDVLDQRLVGSGQLEDPLARPRFSHSSGPPQL